MKYRAWLLATLAATGLALGPAGAAPLAIIDVRPPPATAMTVGEPTRGPIGFVMFCRTWPAKCAAGAATGTAWDAALAEAAVPKPPALTPARWRELERVDAEVDRAILPADDGAAQGLDDHWSLAPARGDCEDYVLTKRHRLIELGWPAHALLVTLVREERGRQHAVLVVRTDRGDLVLDNLSRGVAAWNRLAYRWIKRQSAADPTRWVKLDGYAEEMADRLDERLQRLSLR